MRATVALSVAVLATLWSSQLAAGSCPYVKDCETCSNPGPECYKCPYGQTLASDRKSCVGCSTSCKHCDLSGTSTTCTECNVGSALNNGVCVDCPSFCAKCTASGASQPKCEMCYRPHTNGNYYALSTIGNCVSCGSNCVECTADQNDVAKCSKCARGNFLVSSSGQCSRCPSWCVDCSDDGTGKGSCSKAMDGFVVNVDVPTASCLKCPAWCKTCSTTAGNLESGNNAKCEECKGPYWLDNQAVCSTCTSYCDKCASSSECDQNGCAQDYYYDTGSCTRCTDPYCHECTKDVNTCAKCYEGWGPKAAKTCDRCGSNCNRCSSPTTCSQCRSGYTINSLQQCVACPAMCTACSYNPGTAKTECLSDSSCNKDGAIAVKNLAKGCTLCPAGCSRGQCDYNTLSLSAECLACDTAASPQSPNDNGFCTNCPANCDSCTYNSTFSKTICLTCSLTYGLDMDGACQACENCNYCEFNDTISGSNKMDCRCDNAYTVATWDDARGDCPGNNLCASGFYFVQDGEVQGGAVPNDYCLDCDLDGCVTCNSTLGCTACLSAGWVANSQLVCKACPPMCTTCTIAVDDQTTVCTACAPGYGKLTDGSACSPCASIGCLACVDQGQGVFSVCSTCNTAEGYVLGGGSCHKCDSNCATSCSYVSPKTQCTSCDNSGSKKYALNPTTGKCISCPSNCRSCTWDPATSKTVCSVSMCAPGYARKDDGTCEKCGAHCNACQFTSGVLECIGDSYCDYEFGLKAKECLPCPNNCRRCPLDVATDQLVCNDCKTTYIINDKMCGDCGDKCATCTEEQGSMKCSACLKGYALNSQSTCVGCPSNCDREAGCAVSGAAVLCKACNDGYGRTFDGQCARCADLTTVANCDECHDQFSKDEVTYCESCLSQFEIREDHKLCLDKFTGCVETEDKSWQCSQCATKYTLTDDKKCALNCNTCGVQVTEDGVIEIPSSSCNVDGTDYTNTTTELCFTGACWAKLLIDDATGVQTAVRGCLNITCTDQFTAENCKSANGKKECVQCCVGDTCNTVHLKGQNAGASFVHLSAFLLAAISILAFREHF